MKISLCIAGRTTDCKIWFATSLAQTRWPAGAQVTIVSSTGNSVKNELHDLFKMALDHKPDWIIYVGVDVGWQPNDIAKLIAHDKDIIGGWSNGRYTPFNCHVCDRANDDWTFFKMAEHPENRKGLEKVCTVGGEMTVYRANVFERVKYPWFFGVDGIGPNGRMMTEDYYFSKKAHEAGIDTWVDWDVKLQHVADGLVTYDGQVVVYNRI